MNKIVIWNIHIKDKINGWLTENVNRGVLLTICCHHLLYNGKYNKGAPLFLKKWHLNDENRNQGDK